MQRANVVAYDSKVRGSVRVQTFPSQHEEGHSIRISDVPTIASLHTPQLEAIQVWVMAATLASWGMS